MGRTPVSRIFIGILLAAIIAVAGAVRPAWATLPPDPSTDWYHTGKPKPAELPAKAEVNGQNVNFNSRPAAPAANVNPAPGPAMHVPVEATMGGKKLPIDVGLEHGTKHENDNLSPRMLATQKIALAEKLDEMCKHKNMGMVSQVIREFPPEAGAFYAGLAMSAEHQVGNDPGALLHYYEQNLVDPLAHVSFAFFMIGSRATNSLLTMAGLNFDPCSKKNQDLIRNKTGKLNTHTGALETGIERTRVQKYSAWAVGPVGMAGGFMLSSLVHEFLGDKDIRLCAQGLVLKMDEKKMQERNTACDKAYEHWVSSRKIAGYAPDILSMAITATIQGYLINWPIGKTQEYLRKTNADSLGRAAAAAASKNTGVPLKLGLKSILIATGAVPGGGVVRFGIHAVNALIFVTVNEWILPTFKFPWDRRLNGKDITSRLNDIHEEIERIEKNNWVWVPKPKDPACENGHVSSTMTGFDGFPSGIICEDSPRVGPLVRKLGEKHKQWRDVVLMKAQTAHSNWSSYLQRFTSIYSNSFLFYKELLELIRLKNTAGAPPSPLVEKLYSRAPFNGINIKPPANVCALKDEDKALLKKAGDVAAKALNERNTGKAALHNGTDQVVALEKIIAGFTAIDCTQEILPRTLDITNEEHARL